MIPAALDRPLLVVVGAGGVGKTTLAAALGVASAQAGDKTLVMTFDPSLRLKDALGVGDAAVDTEVLVALEDAAELHVSLLDAKSTFDRLVQRYAPDADAAERIAGNRFYQNLAGHLAGILEYMAVERLFEVARAERYDRIILDTPPTRQALDFLEAPDRIIGFLDSGAVRIALRPWFSKRGRFKLGVVKRQVAKMLDRVVGLDLLLDMAEFFQAFGPLYDGFHERATEVRALLRSPETCFLLVAGPGEERVPDALFFARRLREAGHTLGALAVNQIHPPVPDDVPSIPATADGLALLRWLAARDAQGLQALTALVTDGTPVAALPLLPVPPTRVADLSDLAGLIASRVAAAS